MICIYLLTIARSIDFYIIADKAVKLTQPSLKTNLSWRGDVDLICAIWHDTYAQSEELLNWGLGHGLVIEYSICVMH